MNHRTSNRLVHLYDRISNNHITTMPMTTHAMELIARSTNLTPATVRRVLNDDYVQLLSKNMYFVGGAVQ